MKKIIVTLAFVALSPFATWSSPPPPVEAPLPAQRLGNVRVGGAESILAKASKELSSIYRQSVASVVVIEAPPMSALAGSWNESGEDAEPDTTTSTEESNLPTETQGETGAELSDTASGIIFSKESHILTNHHVIQHVLSDHVRVKLRDGRLVRARIVGSDPKTDIAVLQLPKLDQLPPPLKRGDSDLVEVGDFVCAIGSPYGLEYSLTAGIVSGRGRNPLTFSAYEDYIQTDAAINPGNSGGPLLNERGEWVGVNTLINGINRGLGFAVPANQAMKIANEIIARGAVTRPWIGIRVVSTTLMEENYVLEISRVSENSPAARAGIKPKDVVVTAGGGNVKYPPDLQKKIWEVGVGGELVLEIRRGKSLKTRKIKTAEMPENEWVH